MKNLTEAEKVKIKEMVADKLGYCVEEVQDDSLLKDNLGADSLDEVELIMELEKMFDISIPDEDYEDMTDISFMYSIVERYI